MSDLTRYFLQQACAVAQQSPDPSTQNGAVLVDSLVQGPLNGDTDNGWRANPIVLASGCNEYPVYVNYGEGYEERFERPLKYSFIEHAERNALYDAAFEGIRTRNLIMLSPWAACADCARGIIQCGISELITLKPEEVNDRWDSSIGVAMTMLKEAGVKVTYFEGKVFDEHNQITLRRNGETWLP